MATKRPERVTLRDPAAIKTLAHPARLAVLDQLMPDNELTATEIAETVGMSPSAMSYHLRQLAGWKIVEPAESSDGRERRWRINPAGFVIEPEHPLASAAAVTTLIGGALDRQRREVLAWFASAEAEDAVWNTLATIATSFAWMTETEMRQLTETVQTAVAVYADRDAADRPEGARRVQVGFVNVPTVSRRSR